MTLPQLLADAHRAKQVPVALPRFEVTGDNVRLQRRCPFIVALPSPQNPAALLVFLARDARQRPALYDRASGLETASRAPDKGAAVGKKERTAPTALEPKTSLVSWLNLRAALRVRHHLSLGQGIHRTLPAARSAPYRGPNDPVRETSRGTWQSQHA